MKNVQESYYKSHFSSIKVKNNDGLLSKKETEFANKMLQDLFETTGAKKTGKMKYISSIKVPQGGNLRIVSSVMNTYYNTDIYNVKNLAKMNDNKVYGPKKKIKNVKSIIVDPTELITSEFLKTYDTSKKSVSSGDKWLAIQGKAYLQGQNPLYSKATSLRGKAVEVAGLKLLDANMSNQRRSNHWYSDNMNFDFESKFLRRSSDKQKSGYKKLIKNYFNTTGTMPTNEMIKGTSEQRESNFKK